MSIFAKIGGLVGIKRPNEDNERYVEEVVNKYARLFDGCTTDAEKQARIDALTDDERREMGNVATYIKLKSQIAYSKLTDDQRANLKAGNLAVL